MPEALRSNLRVGGGELDACWEESLSSLEASARAIVRLEREIESHLDQAVAGTIGTMAACLGPPERATSSACVGAFVQHVARLVTLERVSDDYSRAAADYQEQLAAHLSCLGSLAPPEDER